MTSTDTLPQVMTTSLPALILTVKPQTENVTFPAPAATVTLTPSGAGASATVTSRPLRSTIEPAVPAPSLKASEGVPGPASSESSIPSLSVSINGGGVVFRKTAIR